MTEILHTTGGTFDPDEGYDFFLASNPEYHEKAIFSYGSDYPNLLVAVNDLGARGSLDALDSLLDRGCKILIDSGVFNLTMGHARTHGMTMDQALILPPDELDGFDELYDRYCTIAARYADRAWGMIEIDAGGPQVKPVTRARIVADTGITPIPVIHLRSDGWDYYDTVASSHDRVCMGNLVKAAPSDREKLFEALSERSRRDHPGVWHHLLGVSPTRMLAACPIKGSSDSSSWLAASRWSITGTVGSTAGTRSFKMQERLYPRRTTSTQSTNTYISCNIMAEAAKCQQYFLRRMHEAYGSLDPDQGAAS